MTSKPKVAAAQLAPVFMDRDLTVEKSCHAIRDAGENGAQLVAFPETFIPGYPYWAMVLDPTSINPFLQKLYDQAVVIPSHATNALCAAAKEAECYVVMGLNERDGGTLYNSQLFIGPDGEILGKRRKLVPTSHERLVWGRGDGSDLQIYSTQLGIVGGLICYEHANALFRYALQGQREQIHVAVWPGGMASINNLIDAAARHYAFEGQSFVINVTSLLTEEIISSMGKQGSVHKLKPGGGYSGVLSPRGEWLIGPEQAKEELLYAELDFQLIDRMKMIVDTAGHYARPDVVRLLLNRKPMSPIETDNS
ncbi:MAG: carbon-nitrogen hydrolase family protein [Thermodesulfobacteriota bacterium]